MAIISTVKVGSRTIELHGLSGEVVAEKKWTTEHSSGGGVIHHADGQISRQPISTSTTTHDQVLLRTSDGQEHALQVSDVHLATRPGHHLSLMWGIKKPKTDGPYIAVYNHDTRARDLILSGMKKLAWPQIGIKTTIFLVGILVAALSGTALAIVVGPALFLGLPLLGVVAIVRYLRRMKALTVEIDKGFERYIGSLP